MAGCTNLTLGSERIPFSSHLDWTSTLTFAGMAMSQKPDVHVVFETMAIGKPSVFRTSLQRQVTRLPCFPGAEQTRVHTFEPSSAIPDIFQKIRPQWNRHHSLLRPGLVGRISQTTALAEARTGYGYQVLPDRWTELAW